jgi:radical SAM superfamily enzyme YgiQ (UPF0313 family)
MHHHSIILTTINARYSHTAFGLRWLWANLGPLRDQAVVREFHLRHAAHDIVEALLAEDPRIIGFGVYIWNLPLISEVVQTIKAVRPGIVLVLGGPEASHEYEGTDLFAAADFLVRGEGEEAFARLAQDVLNGGRPVEKVIESEPPDLDKLALPYDAYTDEDIAQRVVYVEASRGCPFRCEFCLSSLDLCVREFPLDPFFDAMQKLIDRGTRLFKFVDRTFNLRPDRVDAILDFFLERWQDGMQLHFEILPDRLSEHMLERMARFPAEGLHLEVGVQSLCPEALEAISRPQDLDLTERNLRFLRHQTSALIHVDLVAGLPGESWESLAAGFDRLLALRPHHIQVGILKRLKGAPIARHAESHAMAFSRKPPYAVLQTDLLDFTQVQRIKRFARYFDLYYNSENFPDTLPFLWRTGPSAFDVFMALSDGLWAATERTHQLPLPRLAQHLHDFLVQSGIEDPLVIADAVKQDYHRLPGRKDKLTFLV